MSVTILGYHIRLIRPERIRKSIVFKSDLPRSEVNKEPVTNELDEEQRLRIGMVFPWTRPRLFNN